MDNKDFTYSFQTTLPVNQIFAIVSNAPAWWRGLHNETITGESTRVGDVFRFVAGGGVHDTTQRLTRLVPNEQVGWDVIDSNLSFLQKKDEWTGTHFYFALVPGQEQTTVTFTHKGLQPEIECYNACSSGWTGYLKKLEADLTKGNGQSTMGSEQSSISQ